MCNVKLEYLPQIRYKGIKLSQYKTVYIKKHQLGSPEAVSWILLHVIASLRLGAPNK